MRKAFFFNWFQGEYKLFDPFHATYLFWYPLKKSENLWFSDVSRGYQKISVAWNGLIRLKLEAKFGDDF